ncbi:MAG: hypothetical protein ACPLY7_00470, partial [Microgenomates group bacterium]
MPAQRKLSLAFFVACVACLFLIFPGSAQATREIIIVSDKSSLLGEEEMEVVASASGFIEGET